MSSTIFPISFSKHRRAMIAVGVVAALIGSVAVTSSAAVATDLVPAYAVTTDQTEIRVANNPSFFGEGSQTSNVMAFQVEMENFTDTPQTYGLSADLKTEGVQQILWLPGSWPAPGENQSSFSDYFWSEVGAHSSKQSLLDGFLPDLPGVTYGFYRIAIDGVALPEPELIGFAPKAGGAHVSIDADMLADNPTFNVGQPTRILGPVVFPGAVLPVTATGLTPGDELGLWLYPSRFSDMVNADYFFFMGFGALLPNDAVYAGEGFVGPDGKLSATLAVPPDLALGPYQLMVGNTNGRNWPAGSAEPVQVVATPPGGGGAEIPVNVGSGQGPTVDSPSVEVDLDSTGVSFEFDTVSASGVTTAFVSDTGPTVSGFEFAGGTPLFYYLHTTAEFTGPVEVCFYYDTEVVGTGPFDINHFANGLWETLTPGPNSDNAAGVACGMTDSFSPFVLAKPIPVAVTLTKVQQCRHGGWATSTNPVFTSQSKCVTYIALGGHTVRQVIKSIFKKIRHHTWW